MRRTTAALHLLPILVAVDLGTKFWAIQNLADLAQPTVLLPGFALRLVLNPGISWGLFAGSPWLVTLVTAAMTLALAIWFARSTTGRDRAAIACILAGAASNLVDRLVNGAVTDFLSFGNPAAPLFTNNMADVWIGLGVIILFGGALIRARKRSAVVASSPSDGAHGL